MKFNISGFTHKGTGNYEFNEDNMLISDVVLNYGEVSLYEQDIFLCFVSDGVGGNQAGSFASSFVLDAVKKCLPPEIHLLKEKLMEANEELIKLSNSRQDLKGCACTLTGMVFTPDFFEVYHVGDSQIWLLRDEMFFKITKDEVLDPHDINSPITNYFGSEKNNLNFVEYSNYPYPRAGDIFLICTDGLFKSINTRTAKSILIENDEVDMKIIKLRDICLSNGADDNVTAILIEAK